MSEFEIKKGVPVPLKRMPRKYPWREMEVGDSFFVPGKTAIEFGGRIKRAPKAAGDKFTCRTVDGGVRVWRIA